MHSYIWLGQESMGSQRVVLSLAWNRDQSWFLYSVLRLMPMHVCLPGQYVRTRQAGMSLATTCQIQKTLWSINQSERWSELPVSFLPPNMVQASWWMSGQPRVFKILFQSCQPDSRPAEEIAFGRLRAHAAGGKMGTSVQDAMTFRLFMTAGAVSVDVLYFWSTSFLSLFCLFLCVLAKCAYLNRSLCMLNKAKDIYLCKYVWGE